MKNRRGGKREEQRWDPVHSSLKIMGEVRNQATSAFCSPEHSCLNDQYILLRLNPVGFGAETKYRSTITVF